MPLMKVTINGVTHIVDSPDTRTAKAWGREHTNIKVANATASDIRALDPDAEIPVLERNVTNEVTLRAV